MAKIRSNLAAHASIAIGALVTITIAATARLVIEPRALAIVYPALCHASSHLPAFTSTAQFEPDPVSAIARANVSADDLIIASATGLTIDPHALLIEPFRFALHLLIPSMPVKDEPLRLQPDADDLI